MKFSAEVIEKTLDSFGLKTRVAEINKEEDYIEYCLEIVVGLNLDELEKHSRDLALALASPTGKVKMIIPIPGRALVGIQVPKPTREELEKMKMVDEKNKKLNSGWRKSAGDVVKIIGALFFALGEKISKE
ncbi:MAG: DNA translocase FtsK [Patescibacteria group bacterium]